jgi:hypothetical protein
MRWSLCVFLFSCLPVRAATFVIDSGFGSGVIGSGTPPGVPSGVDEKLFTYDINNRSDLIAGLPIRVTFQVGQFTAPLIVWLSSPGTFQAAFTVTAVLGGVSNSIVSSTYTQVFPTAMPGGQTPAGFLQGSFAEPFSLTVPWTADLTNLSMIVKEEASISGAENGILFAGGGGLLTITTQSVPEPSAAGLATLAVLAAAGRRKPRRARKADIERHQTSAPVSPGPAAYTPAISLSKC